MEAKQSCPSRDCQESRQTQLPPTHAVVHTLPQNPQLFLSVCVSMQDEPQHVGVPVPHALKQEPQFALSVFVSAQ